MSNEQSIEDVKQILRSYYACSDEEFSVHEGDAEYYIEIKIKDHYVAATLIEEFEAIGLTIHSFQSLNGKYDKLMQFCLHGHLKD